MVFFVASGMARKTVWELQTKLKSYNCTIAQTLGFKVPSLQKVFCLTTKNFINDIRSLRNG